MGGSLKLRSPHVSEFQSMFSLAFRTRRYGIEYEYEYHFIEYEYDKSQSCATSKTMAGAMGTCSRATQYDTQIAYVRVGRTRQKDMTCRTQERVRIAPL
jgi:hypothetical protein